MRHLHNRKAHLKAGAEAMAKLEALRQRVEKDLARIRRPRTSHSPAANTLWIRQRNGWIKIVNARVERNGDELTVTGLRDPGDIPPRFYFKEDE